MKSEKDKEFRIYRYPLLGHTFLTPTSRMFDELRKDNFEKHIIKTNDVAGISIKRINFVEDIDYTFRHILD